MTLTDTRTDTRHSSPHRAQPGASTSSLAVSSLAVSSPIGTLTLRATDQALISVDIGQSGPAGSDTLRENTDSTTDPAGHPVLAAAKAQLEEYFAGSRDHFDLPVLITGTPFQEAVWDALQAIPYGETASYGHIAQAIGRPGAARAVGGAVGANPVPIVVPCHRVMGSTGKITGYSGGDGILTKRALLAHEQGPQLAH